MSKYTTELRYLCESLAGMRHSEGYSAAMDFVIPQARERIFDFSYPIFDENYKSELETKIIKHYYTREICEETFGLWKLRLDDKMNTIMPYYNQLYESALIKFDPLIDVQYSVNHSGNKTESSTDIGHNSDKRNYERNKGKNIDYTDTENRRSADTLSTENTGEEETVNYNLHSDTPEGGIDGINILESEHSVYLSDATKNTGEKTTTDKGQNIGTSQESGEKNKKGTEIDNTIGEDSHLKEFTRTNEVSGGNSYIDVITGKRSNYSMSKMIREFRETFLNIDKMIINELEPLFFMLW